MVTLGVRALWKPTKHEKAPQLYRDLAEKDAGFCEVHNLVFYLGGVIFIYGSECNNVILHSRLGQKLNQARQR